jgi:hypothetical protein
MVSDCIFTVFDCANMATLMSIDYMLETFSEMAVKESDLMRLALQASDAALVNVQSVMAVTETFILAPTNHVTSVIRISNDNLR